MPFYNKDPKRDPNIDNHPSGEIACNPRDCGPLSLSQALEASGLAEGSICATRDTTAKETLKSECESVLSAVKAEGSYPKPEILKKIDRKP